MDCKLLTSWIK